jgi:hypothetical protein
MMRQIAGSFAQYELGGEKNHGVGVAVDLGHRNIQHTVRYTELSPTRFRDFWRE